MSANSFANGSSEMVTSNTDGGPATASVRQVVGMVRHADGTPIDRMLVHAYNRRVAGEQELSVEVLTDDKGHYAIAYQLPEGTSRVDVFVRASADGEVTSVSPIVIDAGVQETLDLIVTDPRFRGPSEFARTSTLLGPQVDERSVDRLDANDVALLVRTTGVSREAVTAWIAARRLVQRADIDHESLFGLIRNETTASLPRLLRRPPARLLRSLRSAAESNLISHSAGQRAPATITRLRQLRARLSGSSETPGSLGRLLATCTRATAAQQQQFIEQNAEHDGTAPELWRRLRDDPGFGDEAVDDVQLSLRLGTLVANHPPLVQALRESGVTHPAQTATLGAKGWRDLLTAKVNGQPVGTPGTIRGSTAAQRSENYVKLLTERSARAYPTAHVAKSLRALPEWHSATATEFLDLNPDFNLLSRRVSTGLDAPNVVIRPEWDRDQLRKELATVQRSARAAPRGTEETVVTALLGNGYTSALAIAHQSRSAFRSATATAFVDPATADQVYGLAQAQVARTASAYALMHPLLGGGMVKAIGGISADVADDPTWASLFGSTDYCACPHCQSIFGPAAYLVDLLSWLDGHQFKKKTAFERLDARRPDLQRIELSCANTNTVLPYVDLVNEILEVLVLARSGGASRPEVPAATTGTSPDLLANPEHLNPKAYDDHLAKDVFAPTLPFDLWAELGRVYFEHLGVPRIHLMETLRAARPGDRTDIDAERLALSMTQWRILTGAARHDVWTYWGYRTATPDGVDYKSDLATVSTFLRRAAISYEDLLDLLHSRYANPGSLRITGADCDTDQMKIANLTDDDLDRQQRFLRLWRNRGWTILELDKALHGLGLTNLDDAGLGRLADLQRVMAGTGAPLLEALSWWGPMDTYIDRLEKEVPVKSLYDRVYLNRAVDAAAEEPDFPLALDAARTELANPPAWDDVRPLLQAALTLDADELALLLDATIDGLPNPHRVVTGTDADLEGLSALHRHTSMARRLGLAVTELLELLPMLGLNPFDLENPHATLDLIEDVEAISTSDFSLVELHYLLEHDPAAQTSVGVTDEEIGQTLVGIRDGLARVASDHPLVADPVGEVTGQYLAVLLDADGVAAVMTALRTEADAANHAELEGVITEHLGGSLAVDAAALIALPVERRFTALVGVLAPHLQRTQGGALIIEQVAGFVGRELDSVQDLLSLRLRMVVDGRPRSALNGLLDSPYTATTASDIVATDDPEAFDALRRAHKAALVLNRLALDRLGPAIDAQVWLFDVGVHHGLADPLALPIVPTPAGSGIWTAWQRLLGWAALGYDLPGGEPTVLALLQLLESTDDPAVAEETFRTALTDRTTWPRDDLDALTAAVAPAYPDDWRDGRLLAGLAEAFALLSRLGVPATQAFAWAHAPIGFEQAEELRLTAKAKHDEERWPAIARALRDPVREHQRAALVTHLIARDDTYDDEEDLFDDLLIDVEMDPCMLTSRLKQAISTVQLFVQRALMNLEPGVELSRDDRDEWEWRKNYRVWEAARKVFLYPEDFTEPDLRPDKSYLFEQLESTLQQGELDDVAAENAYTKYVQGLLGIARLEVMGVYHQFEEDGDGRIDVLHVVARTRAHPHQYHYRQWIGRREWTPWEEIDAEVEGDHVILAVHDRRLYMFWPMAVQKAEGDGATNTNHVELKLAWVERMHEHWGARKLSDEALIIDDATWAEAGVRNGTELRTFFRLAPGPDLRVECRFGLNSKGVDLLGAFVVDAGTGRVFVDPNSADGVELVAPTHTIVHRMRFQLYSGSAALAETAEEGTAFVLMRADTDADGQIVGLPEEVTVLGKVSGRDFGTYAYPHQYGEFASQQSVFLDDDDRTFQVIPEPAIDWDRFSEPDEVEPSDVGTTDSSSDVFEPPEEEQEIEFDLPWDKAHQEPPLTSQKATGRPATAATSGDPSTEDAPALQESVRATDLQADAELAATLTAGNLQQTQSQLLEVALIDDPMTVPMTTNYRFSLFYHPYAPDFMTELRRSGVTGLLDPSPDGSAPRLVRQQKSRLDFFATTYEPTSAVRLEYPIQDIDFAFRGSYARYNWELFFHAPMLIAGRLSANQRFDEARRWYHFMFDPTNRSDDDDPLRFWKIKPFYHAPDAPIEDFLALAGATEDSAAVTTAREAYDQQVETWAADPFSPHRIAELRTSAYQKSLVMKYLDNLLSWGDQLFRQDTIESLNEATQLYVLALQLLGERPDQLPPRSAPVTTTFEQIRADLPGSVLNNPLVQLENLIPAPRDGAPLPPLTGAASGWAHLLLPKPPPGSGTPSAPPEFYFTIPPNEKLTGYWDLVEDRLFKIRHCMNIEGVVRQLPLFEPSIDPGALVRARAAGIDLASALADLSAPLPHYRFSVMLQKATALNQTVRGLGAALLAALEKNDAEALAALRANQEVSLLEAMRQVKKLAVEEARHAQTAAERSQGVVEQRRDYYRTLITLGVRPEEVLQLLVMEKARKKQQSGSTMMNIAGGVANIPAIKTGAAGFAASPVVTATIVAGLSLAKGLEQYGQALVTTAASLNAQASSTGIMAAHLRRAEEWQQQLTLAEREISQIAKQIEAAAVRAAMAEKDLENHDRQTESARTVREFMESKFTTPELYSWVVGQLSSLYFQSYQLTYDLAKQAERAYRHELALPEATFISFGYWDSLKKGLLAGDRLQHDLERMDAGYLNTNRREYEITRHVSLALLDPTALTQLRTGGSCEFSVPEVLFDLDYPGQYLRRITSVGVSVPCVTGPYTGMPMRLTLVASRTRTDPSAAGDYPMEVTADDPRFSVQTGAVQSIVLSGGREDAGMFVSDHRDERYLPFEGSGAISDWNLALTSAVATFDWSSITDVVLHLRYTAREGGDLLREAALGSLNDELAGLPLSRAFSARSDWPTPWNAFLRPSEGSTEATLSVPITEDMFPHFTRDAGLRITHLSFVALVPDPGEWRGADVTVTTDGEGQVTTLIGSPTLYGNQPTGSVSYESGAPPGTWDISVPIGLLGAPAEWIEDLMVIVTYQATLRVRAASS